MAAAAKKTYSVRVEGQEAKEVKGTSAVYDQERNTVQVYDGDDLVGHFALVLEFHRV